MLSAITSRLMWEPQASSLPALLASWPTETSPPRFLGKPKKDLPIDTWLAKVAEACVARGIPQKLWHEVAKHFMSEEARVRLEEVEKVMQCVYGHRWAWKWLSFGVALKNMGWNIDKKKTEAVKVQRKSTGSWWIIGRGGDKGNQVKTKEPLPLLGFIAKLAQKTSSQKNGAPPTAKPSCSKLQAKRPQPTPVQTSKGTATTSSGSVIARVATTLHIIDPPPPPPTTFTAQVPFWLLAASEAIFALTADCSSTMSILAAVLITVGSIPALPSVAAGATAHALGTVAVGLGTVLRERAIAADKGKEKR